MASTISPKTLDIEHLFGLVSRHNRTDVLSPQCPRRRTEPTRRRSYVMAMIRVEPVEVRVRTGWFDGSPREITWGEERLSVTRLTAVREEAAAFPVITGPRTLFEVETPRARLALTFQHRSRRWTITALDEERRVAA
jgi:hypothetical protein